MTWEAVVEHTLITGAIHIATRLRRLRFVKCRLVQPNVDIRVSFAALLLIEHSGQYVLVQNRRRPELFGPFGGVYKYLEPAKRKLNELEFKPQVEESGPDMKDDFRGFLPRKNLARLYKWYLDTEDRESPGACLYRELCKELQEIDVRGAASKPPPAMSLHRVRVVEEGPEQVPGQQYTQYRILEVYKPIVSCSPTERFIRKLVAEAQKHPKMVLANADEIIKGRTATNEVIGHQTVYLVSSRRIRGEDMPFAHGVSHKGPTSDS